MYKQMNSIPMAHVIKLRYYFHTQVTGAKTKNESILQIKASVWLLASQVSETICLIDASIQEVKRHKFSRQLQVIFRLAFNVIRMVYGNTWSYCPPSGPASSGNFWFLVWVSSHIMPFRRFSLQCSGERLFTSWATSRLLFCACFLCVTSIA